MSRFFFFHHRIPGSREEVGPQATGKVGLLQRGFQFPNLKGLFRTQNLLDRREWRRCRPLHGRDSAVQLVTGAEPVCSSNAICFVASGYVSSIQDPPTAQLGKASTR